MAHPLVRPALALALLASTAAVGVPSVSQADHIVGTSCTSKTCGGHEFWPRMTLADVQVAPKNKGATLRGRPGKTDELLGYHGSDTLYGEDQDDVLWADHVGTGQPTGQFDRLFGGPGDDFLYSSRGRNALDAGPGNDAIKTRYGRGTLNCGPGRDIVHVPKSRRKNWTFKNCEVFEARSESALGRGLKTLP